MPNRPAHRTGAAKAPFFDRRIPAKQIDLPESGIDTIEDYVGGGYGARGEFYPEDFLFPSCCCTSAGPCAGPSTGATSIAMNHAREHGRY